jgi:hypothetical protein
VPQGDPGPLPGGDVPGGEPGAEEGGPEQTPQEGTSGCANGKAMVLGPMQQMPGPDTKWDLVRQLLADGGQSLDLRGQDLDGADLRGVRLRGADLRRASLRNANLERASLCDCRLEGADLRGAAMGVGRRRVRLKGAVFDADTRWSAGFNPTCWGACRIGPPPDEETARSAPPDPKWVLVRHLHTHGGRGADLRGHDFEGADLRGVSLTGADLRGANLRSANLVGTSLRAARLEGTDLLFARMHDGHRSVHVRGACFDTRTQWPVGFDPREWGARFIEPPSEVVPAGMPDGRGDEAAEA